ncbi:MAG: 2,3-bisphosphoglycerate-independent phosphoglycerate mutase [Oscillospiraceae bacterium]
MMKKPVALIILDGFGLSDCEFGNAIHQANKPILDSLFANCPNTKLSASGLDVGLPEGQMGNSEVGHTNIGSGRVVYQELTRITKSIKDGDFFTNTQLVGATENCKKHDSALHLFGLLSTGGVHSHMDHLYALLELAKKQGVTKVYLHAFMDGRDVPPSSGKGFIEQTLTKMEQIGVGKIATISGRYYAMDRDNRWERVELAYKTMVSGAGHFCANPLEVITASYQEEKTDEFILPTLCDKDGLVKEHDSVIFFNFRPDRARELTRCFVDPTFDKFTDKNNKVKTYFVCLTQYDSSMPNVHIAFTPQTLTNTLGEYVSKQGMAQLRITETEKYAHVTFFFNGGVEQAYEKEDRALIASPAVATYNLQPEMSAKLITDEVIDRLDWDKYDMIILNYANCDMVGHTGILDAAVKAVETVDVCLDKLLKKIKERNGVAFITADHGNADQMYETNGSAFTAHTTNPVPLIVVGLDCKLRHNGVLADIAPTMLQVLGLEKPIEMTGTSLLFK